VMHVDGIKHLFKNKLKVEFLWKFLELLILLFVYRRVVTRDRTYW
jgi:hypothetical protein